jgi:hypothetical protein
VGIQRIISGGQTGADRAALDFAIANGIAHGGWCPKGRKAENGVIPAKYALQETPSAAYLQRNESPGSSLRWSTQQNCRP